MVPVAPSRIRILCASSRRSRWEAGFRLILENRKDSLSPAGLSRSRSPRKVRDPAPTGGRAPCREEGGYLRGGVGLGCGPMPPPVRVSVPLPLPAFSLVAGAGAWTIPPELPAVGA